MSEPTLNYVSCPDARGQHRMGYWSWGETGAGHVIVCVHGLSRQGRDFDALAAALLARADHGLRVVCPDVVGRGRSEWLADPMGYVVPQYAADMLTLLAQLQAQAPVATLDWVGTSMGGLIGIGIAGSPALLAPPEAGPGPRLPAPVRRLVLNDVGPAIRWQALARIGTYLGDTGRFASVEEAADAMWAISRSFGPHTPQQWLALSRHMVRPLPDGGFTLHYDPAIAVPFRALTEAAAQQGEQALWALYDQITARTLLTRGAESDLLARDTAQAMTRRGPRARLVEFAGVGHAPTFLAADQIEAVASFLLEPDSP
ncbi:alpha/beta hydrolase [Ramlibacter sp.]|uniref:alpha/beta fold hydrolase n=1 Tax=Ramlibacter sp. TaxID=1917967 RepID=UPI002C30501E|nr:alpha/beta hydrolase [Ramlibacter sp.]HWI81548.1 alpha/beta hydrolase [Ramlibacter sp.]